MFAFVAAGSGLAWWAQMPQATGTWSSFGVVAHARMGAASVTLNDGRTLILGGRRADGVVTADVHVLDPRTGVTESAGQLTTPRVNHTVILLTDGRVLAGGSFDGVITATLEIFDLSTGG